ncbi:MAG: hypothetical protein O7G85_00335 [Planctomycetota bacterium]|nr:hypothetical protein [Planctomycetota bacterium]
MSRTMKSIAGVTLLASVALGMSGCESESKVNQVSWQSNGMPYYNAAGAHTWHYKFVHFPESDVYYEPHTKTYFWKYNGLWNEGSELPSWVYLQGESWVVVNSETEIPYPQNEIIAFAD